MLVRHDRPRDLRWYLAGPMFFGDLGTSRLYVLGLAFFYSGLAAPWFVAAICTLVAVVGWAYTIICRVNPDGGGVYSSGRMIHPTLGAIGAFLLFANYVVTAAISTYEAVIYIGVPLGMDRALAPILSVLAIGLNRRAQLHRPQAGRHLRPDCRAGLNRRHRPAGQPDHPAPTRRLAGVSRARSARWRAGQDLAQPGRGRAGASRASSRSPT